MTKRSPTLGQSYYSKLMVHRWIHNGRRFPLVVAFNYFYIIMSTKIVSAICSAHFDEKKCLGEKEEDDTNARLSSQSTWNTPQVVAISVVPTKTHPRGGL